MSARRVLYLQYTNPAAYPPLVRSSRILADAEWDVLFVGIDAPHVRGLRMPAHPRVRMTLLPWGAWGWRLKLHYAWFCAWSIWQALRFRPQWIYASDIMAAFPALIMARLLRRRVVLHEHDAYEHEAPGVFMRAMIAAFNRLARAADVNVVPNRVRLEAFRSRTGAPADRCVLVWNTPSVSEVRQPKAGPAGPRLRLLFQGAIVPERLPTTLLDALARLPDQVCLRLVGYEQEGSRGYIAHLREAAAARGLEHRVECLGPVSHDALLALADDCDVGLATIPLTGDLNLRAMAGASNKVFEYLACGLPLLVSPLPEWESTFVAPGYARVCRLDDVESVVTAVRAYLKDPAGMREAGERGRQRILEAWNYEAQFAAVFSRMRG